LNPSRARLEGAGRRGDTSSTRPWVKCEPRSSDGTRSGHRDRKSHSGCTRGDRRHTFRTCWPTRRRCFPRRRNGHNERPAGNRACWARAGRGAGEDPVALAACALPGPDAALAAGHRPDTLADGICGPTWGELSGNLPLTRAKGKGQRAEGREEGEGKGDERQFVPSLCPLPSALCPPSASSMARFASRSASPFCSRGTCSNVTRPMRWARSRARPCSGFSPSFLTL
jgi:hypothetical protein